MTTEHIYTRATDVAMDATSSFDITVHDGSSKGLKLAGQLVKSTQSEIDAVCDVSARLVNVTGSTLTMTSAIHGGKITTINAAAGCAVTLPAATGTGNIFTVIIGTTIGVNTTTFTCVGSDKLTGSCTVSSTGTSGSFAVPATSTVVTMNGSSKGGVVGSYLQLIDIATNVWAIRGSFNGTGVAITPIS